MDDNSNQRLSEFLQAERALAESNHQRLAMFYDRPLETLSKDQVSIRNSNDLFKPDRPWVNPTPPHGPGLAHPSTA